MKSVVPRETKPQQLRYARRIPIHERRPAVFSINNKTETPAHHHKRARSSSWYAFRSGENNRDAPSFDPVSIEKSTRKARRNASKARRQQRTRRISPSLCGRGKRSITMPRARAPLLCVCVCIIISYTTCARFRGGALAVIFFMNHARRFVDNVHPDRQAAREPKEKRKTPIRLRGA